MRLKVIKPLGHNQNVDLVKISFCDQNTGAAEALAGLFQEVDSVEVLTGD